MEQYQYAPLTENDIRLVTLLPGQFDDDIEIFIEHAPLEVEQSQKENSYESTVKKVVTGRDQQRLSVRELQKTVPDGWDVFETREGRIVFRDPTWRTTWNHPNPKLRFDKESYGSRKRPEASVRYEALSYCWGPEGNEVDISVRSNEHHPSRERKYGQRRVSPSRAVRTVAGTVRVRQNLWLALRYLRLDHQSRTLWCDSICIDQNNVEERNAQVGRMADIYSLAPAVLVWLGATADGGEVGLKILGHLGDQALETTDSLFLPDPAATEIDWFHPAKSVLPYDATTWNAVKAIFEQEYFRRLWTWQEVVLGDDRSMIQYGLLQIPWYRLRMAIKLLCHRSSILPKHTRDISTHCNFLSNVRRNVDVFVLISRMIHQKCTDPKDKIYALMGLMDPVSRNHIRPDYTLEIWEVYQTSHLATIERYSNLSMMNFCDLASRQIGGPSWVPDVSWESETNPLTTNKYCSTLDTPATVQHAIPGQLEVAGVLCTTIRSVHSHALRFTDLAAVRTQLQSWLLALQGATHATGETVAELCAITLCAGEVSESCEYGEGSGFFTTAEARKWFLELVRNENLPLATLQAMEDNRYVRSVKKVAIGRVLIMTDDGRPGLAPLGAQAGMLPWTLKR